MVVARILRKTTVALCLCLAACAPKGVEPLAKPVKIDSYCSERVNVQDYPRTTSMGSILTSVYESLPAPGTAPSLAQYKAALATSGGAIAYYNHLRLLKPQLAKQLGESDGYVVARAAIFTNDVPPDAQTRFIYLELRDHGTYRWQALRAGDVQNICNQGKRSS